MSAPDSTSAHVPPPVACETLAALTTRAGGTLAPLGPPETVAYPLPSNADPVVRALWAAESTFEAAPEVIARIPHGRVYGPGIVLAPDGTTLARDVSLDFGKPFDRHWLLGLRRLPVPVRLEGTVAVVACNLATGYGHWLLDELPRLLALPAGAADQLIAHGTAPWTRSALARLGGTRPVLSPGRHTHWQADTLVVPTLPGTVVTPTRRALARLDAFTADLGRDAPDGSPERLYLVRSGATRRQVRNEAELRAMLVALGFTPVALETCAWEEQIRRFRHARVVVAPHGAGLANLAFSAPGTRVIELFPRRYVHGGYARLAALRGLDYHPLVEPGDTPPTYATDANHDDLTVDLAAVRTAIGGG